MPQSPSSLPPGSWGGDADPNTGARRAQFEVDLQRQTAARQAAMAGQQPVVGQPIVGPAPEAKPPMPGGLYIPPDLGTGGDLISSMGEEEMRTSNDARRAAGMAPERQPEPTAADTIGPNAGIMADHPAPQNAPQVSGPVAKDLAGLLSEVAAVLQRGTVPMMRHLTAQIAAGRIPKAQLPEILSAASEVVTSAVKAMAVP